MLGLQVKIVAGPEAVGVHWKTRSGELPLVAHVPASVLAPLVVPLKTPPAAGTTVAAPQAPPGRVVELVLVVEVTEVLVVVGTAGGVMTTGTVATLFASESSPTRPNGSRVTRSVYVPGGTSVTSRYWQPSVYEYSSEQPALMPWFSQVNCGAPQVVSRRQ